MTEPLDNVRDISRIAYGFMASKVLFAALDLDLFGRLAAAPKRVDELAAATGLLRSRLEILLTACVSLGLLVKHVDAYGNAPASQAYLVRGAPSYFGDYYRFQIDRQVYPAFARLPDALRGERADFYRLMDENKQFPVPQMQRALCRTATEPLTIVLWFCDRARLRASSDCARAC